MQDKNQERRHHNMFRTKNTEYHFRDTLCVGVRDRRTGQWLPRHKALRAHLTGYLDRERRVWNRPNRGRRLHLITTTGWVLTSALLEIERPSKTDIWCYTSLIRSGEIQN